MSEKPVTLIKPNMCPICIGQLVLQETETTTTPIESNGALGSSKCESVIVDAQIICTKCGAKYKAKKSGLFYRIDTGLAPIRTPHKYTTVKNPFYE